MKTTIEFTDCTDCPLGRKTAHSQINCLKLKLIGNKEDLTKLCPLIRDKEEKEEKRYCEKCGIENLKSDKYCHECGNNLRDMNDTSDDPFEEYLKRKKLEIEGNEVYDCHFCKHFRIRNGHRGLGGFCKENLHMKEEYDDFHNTMSYTKINCPSYKKGWRKNAYFEGIDYIIIFSVFIIVSIVFYGVSH